MANAGHFFDRTPVICTAGITTACQKEPIVTVKDCLKHYPLVDQIDALKHEAKIPDRQIVEYVPQKMHSGRNTGTCTEMHAIMNPPVPTRYQTLIDDLKSTTYRTYWDNETGRTRDPTPGLPGGMDPANTTFGMSSSRGESAKELINPDKSVCEVLWNSQEGHTWYRKSHNDYNPGERVCRNYLCPPFNPNRTNGETTLYDPRGIWVRCACTWCVSEPVLPVCKLQADYLERNRPKLGKCITPNKNIECVPKDHSFGKKSTREFYGMEDLLKDPTVKPCLFKRDFLDWMAHLNELRSYIKRRKHMFSLRNYYNAILHYDTEFTGWIPLERLYQISSLQGINFDHGMMEPLIGILGILSCDGYVNYRRFVDLINVDKPTPDMDKYRDLPQESIYFITTYQDMQRDICCPPPPTDNWHLRTAGIPSVRYDLPRSTVPSGGCRADLESLGEETSASALVNPSVYTNYGLSHLDFFRPRQPQVLKALFERLGYDFKEDTFERLWEMGKQRDETDLVCVDTFRMLLEKSVPPPEFKTSSDEEKCYWKKFDPCKRI